MSLDVCIFILTDMKVFNCPVCPNASPWDNIILHIFFHAFTLVGSCKTCLNMRHADLASVNAIEQTCIIIIHACLPDSNQNCTENAAKTLKYSFSYTGLA